VRFKLPVDVTELSKLPGVEILSSDGQACVTLQVAGDMQRLVQALGRLPVLDLETARPSLEEVFLTYYKN
jgi:ABC-2 type transport system ATP-binding protein